MFIHSANAEEAGDREKIGPHDQPVFDLSKNRYFSNAQEVLEGLVQRKSHKMVNHFCVIGYDVPKSIGMAWVYWQEGNAIILWEANTDPAYRLETSRDYLDLKKDVVPTLADVHNSTYLVTREWVREIETDCASRGVNFSIRNSKRKSLAHNAEGR